VGGGSGSGDRYTAAMSERQQKARSGDPSPGPGSGSGTPAVTPEELDFDGRLARLEAIVGELEAGGLGLEASIERYREGIGLLGRCREVLGGFRRQVEELSRDAEQGLSAFEGDPDQATGSRH
jgi:exodeoxyribonuclease VII small subunit